MRGLDASPTFIRHAAEFEGPEPKAIEYCVATAHRLPFRDATFDFAVAFMSLMDMPSPEIALGEAHRVLRPKGMLQFSILHPCFFPPYRRVIRDENGLAAAFEVGDYFERTEGRVDRWLFGGTPEAEKRKLKPFDVPIFHRTLSTWLNSILDAGFILNRVAEPRADAETVERYPVVADTRIVSYFLHLQCIKR